MRVIFIYLGIAVMHCSLLSQFEQEAKLVMGLLYVVLGTLHFLEEGRARRRDRV